MKMIKALIVITAFGLGGRVMATDISGMLKSASLSDRTNAFCNGLVAIRNQADKTAIKFLNGTVGD